eukprot:9259016-Heterocapsa_arctica.AAC.1
MRPCAEDSLPSLRSACGKCSATALACERMSNDASGLLSSGPKAVRMAMTKPALLKGGCAS